MDGSGAIYERIVESSRDGLWVFDPDGRTLYCNQRLADLLGRTREEVLGSHVPDYLDEEGKAQFAQHLGELSSIGQNAADVECVYRHADGTPVELMVSESTLRDDDGTLVGYTHRLTLDAERRNLLHELSRSRVLLDEAQGIAKIGSWELDFVHDDMVWSDQLFRMLGRDPETTEPSRELFVSHLLEEDRAVEEQAVTAGLESDGFTFDARFRRTDGEVRWVRGIGKVTRDPGGEVTHVRGTCQDITEIKEAELKLLDAVVLNSLMQVMASAANEAVTLTEALIVTRGMLLAHEDWLRGVGFSVSTDGYGLHGLTPWPLTDEDPEPDAVELALAERCLEAGRTVFDQETRPQTPSIAFVVRLEGQPLVVVVITAASPFERHDMMEALCTQVADQLARVAARDRAAEQLAAARDSAMEASRLKSEFLATMSHEIRTPLNGVIGLNELLQRTALDDDQRRLAEGVQGAGRSLLGVINDILDFSKIEAGELELEEVDFDARRVFHQATAILEESAHDKGIGLTVHVEDDVPDRLVGDPTRLGQVLSNLISNAIKFTSVGQVGVRAYVDARDGAGVLLGVEVTDTGIGISPHQMERLFEPFRQADASTTRTYGGTGLGLAISRQLVTALGGDIGARSEPGTGSTFWFTAHYGTARPGVRRLEHVEHDAGSAQPQGHVLLVEDNEVNQLVALGFLEALGWTADVAGNGEEAVTRAAGGHYDAILMDLQMPLLDGFAATRLIREGEPEGERVPIIAMTASAFEAEREKCLEAGMDDFLTKPVDSARLASVLRAQVRREGDAAPAEPVVEPVEQPVEPVLLEPAASPNGGTRTLDPSRIEELLEMGEGATVLVNRAIDNFVARVPETVAELTASVAQRDGESVRALAHRLKGSALNLGADRVAEVSLALEESGREGCTDEADALLLELEAALGEASAALAAYRAAD